MVIYSSLAVAIQSMKQRSSNSEITFRQKTQQHWDSTGISRDVQRATRGLPTSTPEFYAGERVLKCEWLLYCYIVVCVYGERGLEREAVEGRNGVRQTGGKLAGLCKVFECSCIVIIFFFGV